MNDFVVWWLVFQSIKFLTSMVETGQQLPDSGERQMTPGFPIAEYNLANAIGTRGFLNK
jgi:hypothetical protein